MIPLDRSAVVEAVRVALRQELATLESVTGQARDEATSEQSRPENKYDTRALEASYLAAGQGERLAALRKLVAWAELLTVEAPAQVGDGALLGLDQDGRERWVLLAEEGGPTVSVDGATVALVSRRSPLGRAMLGTRPGDAVEVVGPRGAYEVVIEHLL